MLNESAAFSVVLSHCCPPRRATRSVVLSHKISTPPACWPGESKFSSGQLSTQSCAKNKVESRNARCWCASCPRGKKSDKIEVAFLSSPYQTKEVTLKKLALLKYQRALPALSISARESAGNNRKEGVHVAAASAPFLVNGAAGSPRRKPPSPSDSISLLTLYMWAPDIYEGSPTPVTAFLSIAPKISIFANISRVSIYGSYGATLQQIFCFCSIASMILGALAAMAQTKVKRPLAHSSIGHVGYIRTGFSCGTIEGIQSLLIGILIYALMTIDAFAIVLALRQTRVKYIADLGALAKTNPISAITFSITMFSYVGIPPLAGFCSKFYLFFAALGCGAYFLAPVGVVTSVIGCWAAGRLPRVSKFGGPKAVLRAPDT
ncbi:hypothetical protein RIF29_47151 [Crotalaria pallida]|uniref:NADH:quinone oxidoreductase/Mrp antiporter transmembrane domain-containing protein n=3 Tax=core genistoids TaxID=2231385 RepID=A0AAN9DRI4_CROPI